jgi:hypothetical protein
MNCSRNILILFAGIKKVKERKLGRVLDLTKLVEILAVAVKL